MYVCNVDEENNSVRIGVRRGISFSPKQTDDKRLVSLCTKSQQTSLPAVVIVWKLISTGTEFCSNTNPVVLQAMSLCTASTRYQQYCSVFAAILHTQRHLSPASLRVTSFKFLQNKFCCTCLTLSTGGPPIVLSLHVTSKFCCFCRRERERFTVS